MCLKLPPCEQKLSHLAQPSIDMSGINHKTDKVTCVETLS